MKPKFVIATTCYTPEGGGPTNRFVDLQCKGLLENDFSVHVFSAYGDKYSLDLSHENLKITQINQSSKIIKLIPSSAQRTVSYLLWTFLMLWKALRNRQAAWIFCGTALSFAITIPCTRFLGGNTCYLEADLPSGIHNPLGGSFAKWVRKVTTQIALIIMARSVHHILLGGSVQLVAYFRNFAPHAHITQAWPPTDVTLFASGNQQRGKKTFDIDENAFLIVYAGSVCAREGILVLLEAFTVVSKMVPGSKLLVAGNIPPAGYRDWLDLGAMDLRAMIKESGISNNIILAGMLEKDDLIDILKAADVLVMPKVEHPYNAVASPIKVGEYLATANPFVSSNICDLDKFFIDGKNILLVEPNNPRLLSERILWVYNNKKEAMVIGEEGFKKAVEMFDYPCWTKTLLKAIKFNNATPR